MDPPAETPTTRPREQRPAFSQSKVARTARACAPGFALPPPSIQELAQLRESIQAVGVLVPVVVSAGPAWPGQVADGHAREAIAAELGLPCPQDRRPFGTEAEFHAFRITTNVTRRQLTDVDRIRLGQLLEPYEREQAAKRRAQAKGKPRGQKSLPVEVPEQTGETRTLVAQAVGLTPSTYARGAKVLREGSPQLIRALEDGRESVHSAYRKLKREVGRAQVRALAEQLERQPLAYPEGRYGVVVIDPPWPHEQLPYPSMTLEQIAAIPLEELLAEDAAIWLWTTNRFIFDAHHIAKHHWQLQHRQILTWGKTSQNGENGRIGTGHCLRGQTEHCLLYTQGNPRFKLTTQSTLLLAPAREHSRKPDDFYELIETLNPGRKLDMFARQHRPGWDPWGAETTLYPPSPAGSAGEGDRPA